MRTLLLVLLAAFAVGGTASLIDAQQSPSGPFPTPTFTPPPPPPPAPTPQPGDIIWAFANEPPFNDPRVVTAFALIFEQRAVPAVSRRILPADPEIRRSLLSSPPRFDQIPLLLAAAGLAPGSFAQVGPCKYHTTPLGPGGEQAAGLLAEAVRDGLLALGTSIERCTFAPNAADAHLLVWSAGGLPPEFTDGFAPTIPVRDRPTFLGSPALSPGSGQPAGRGGGGGAPGPARTGSGGLR